MIKMIPPARLPWLLLGVVAIVAQGWASDQASAAEAARPLAVFPVEFADTSGEVPGADRSGRIDDATAELGQLLADSGKYRPVDLTSVRDRMVAAGPLHRCDGCWQGLAREAGAEVAAVTVVHKMSTLIASMHVWLVDVVAGQVIRDGAVSLRGDTDEAWRRGIRYLVKNVLLKEDPGHVSRSSPFPGG